MKPEITLYDARREGLILLLLRAIASEAELERVEAMARAGSYIRTLRAVRGRVISVHTLADEIIDYLDRNPKDRSDPAKPFGPWRK